MSKAVKRALAIAHNRPEPTYAYGGAVDLDPGQIARKHHALLSRIANIYSGPGGGQYPGPGGGAYIGPGGGHYPGPSHYADGGNVEPVRTERNPEGGYSPVGDVPLDAPKPLHSAYKAIAPAPNTEYGSILPIARDTQTGDVRFAMPSSVRDLAKGALDLVAGTETGKLTPEAINTLTTLPAAGSAPQGALGAGVLRRTAEPIRAYHGSPHTFDKFDFSKIGTGEGAQVYGHGLYFAENPGVAASYRDALAGPAEMRRLYIGDMVLGPHNSFDYSRNAGRSTLDNIHASLAENVLLDEKGLYGAPDKQAFVLSKLDDMMKDYEQSSPEALEAAQKLREKLMRPNAVSLKMGRQPGSTYEVAIHEDPKKFLDWDKAFVDQAPEVQQAVMALAKDAPPPTNGPARRNREKILAGDPTVPGDVLYFNPGGWKNPVETSQRLLDAGIPGIKYLDQSSRAAKEGTSNYVVFPTQKDIIEILRRYASGGTVSEEAASHPAVKHAMRIVHDMMTKTPPNTEEAK